jgi:hypothetical protein
MDFTPYDEKEESPEEIKAGIRQHNLRELDKAKRKILRDQKTARHNPQILVQSVNPETGLPSGPPQSMPVHQIASYDPHAGSDLLQAVKEFNLALEGEGELSPGPEPERMMQAGGNSSAALNGFLSGLGLGFLKEPPQPPPVQVQVRYEGPVRFRIPFPCHHVLRTDRLVLLLSDTRSTQGFREVECDLDRASVRVFLQLPDGEEIPVLPPVPQTVSFEIGVIRCTLFPLYGTATQETERSSAEQPLK